MDTSGTASQWGMGLEQGAYMGVVRRMLRHFETSGQSDKAGVLMTIAAGATWPNERRRAAGYVTDGLCACGRPDTEWHAFWECELIPDTKAVLQSQHLKDRARDEQVGRPIVVPAARVVPRR